MPGQRLRPLDRVGAPAGGRAVVALNALALRPGGSGVQTYVRELLRELPVQTAASLVAHVQADAVAELPSRVAPSVHPVGAGVRRALRGLTLAIPDSVTLVHGLDVDLPVRRRVPAVTTVHDLSVYDVPEASSRRRAAGERLLVRHAVTRADAVIAVSAFTAERVTARFGRVPVTVTPLAPGPGFTPPAPEQVRRLRARLDLPDRFVLQVATVEPRKDVATLAAACAGAGVPLVLAGAGSTGPSAPAAVRGLGYVSGEALPALYAAATVVAYISRYEGFGLPPLEAMACGAAVVASRVGGLPEVVRHPDGLVPPGGVAPLTRLLRDLCADTSRREALAMAGRAAAATLRWADTAAATAQVYAGLGVPLAEPTRVHP